MEDPRGEGFLLFIGSQAFPSLCLSLSFLSASVSFLSLWWKNMEGSLSCDKAVACKMGKRDPSHWGVGSPCQSAPLRAVTACMLHPYIIYREPLLCPNNVGLGFGCNVVLKNPKALLANPLKVSICMNSGGCFAVCLVRFYDESWNGCSLKPPSTLRLPNDWGLQSFFVCGGITLNFHQPWTAKKKWKHRRTEIQHRKKTANTSLSFFISVTLLVSAPAGRTAAMWEKTLPGK